MNGKFVDRTQEAAGYRFGAQRYNPRINCAVDAQIRFFLAFGRVMAPPQIGVFVGQFVFPPVVASDSPDNMLALREHSSREDGPNFLHIIRII